MPPPMKEVYSSNVSAVGYAPDTQELHVTWSTGKTSVYEGVPADLGEQASTSWSIGKFLNENIRDKFPHKYA